MDSAKTLQGRGATGIAVSAPAFVVFGAPAPCARWRGAAFNGAGSLRSELSDNCRRISVLPPTHIVHLTPPSGYDGPLTVGHGATRDTPLFVAGGWGLPGFDGYLAPSSLQAPHPSIEAFGQGPPTIPAALPVPPVAHNGQQPQPVFCLTSFNSQVGHKGPQGGLGLDAATCPNEARFGFSGGWSVGRDGSPKELLGQGNRLGFDLRQCYTQPVVPRGGLASTAPIIATRNTNAAVSVDGSGEIRQIDVHDNSSIKHAGHKVNTGFRV